MGRIQKVHDRNTLHCAIEVLDVLWCNDESFFIVVIIERLLFELGHAGDELLHTFPSMEGAIRFIDSREVALDRVSDSAWLMVFLEMTPVFASWSCFFGFDKGMEVCVEDEGYPGAIAEIAAGELIPLPRLRHHEFLSTAVHATTIMLMQFEYVLTFEVTHAFLTPKKSVPLLPSSRPRTRTSC